MLLDAPPESTLKGKRDRAILATLLYHGLRCEELCTLTVGAIHQREGVPHLRVEGKGDKVRYLPLAVLAQRLITAYLKEAGHSEDLKGPLFRPVKNNRTKTLAKPLHPVSVYQDIVKRYARDVGLVEAVPGLCVHSLRATAATNALSNVSVQVMKTSFLRARLHMAYPSTMETLAALPPDIWARTPPETQAYIRVLEVRVAA